MLTLVKNELLRRSIFLKPTFFFSNSLNEEIERNKAILSSKIIDTICKSPLNSYRINRVRASLRQKILQQINNYQIDKYDQPEREKITFAVRNSLKRYFQEGVWVPKDMCSQKRFKQEYVSFGQLKSLKEQMEMFLTQENDKEYQKLEFRRLQFCPTNFVTGQIFRNIIKGSPFILLKGQFGVGKTYSFILYTLLSEIIFRYKYKYCPHLKMYDQQLKDFKNIPKAFYFCINKELDHHEPTAVNKFIKRHFYELKDTEYSGDFLQTKPFQGIQALMTEYFGIKTVLLVDQISELAGILRNNLNQKKIIIENMLKILLKNDVPQNSNEKQNIKREFQYQNIPLQPKQLKKLNLIQNSNILYRFQVPQEYRTQKLKKNLQQIPKYLSYQQIIYKFIINQHFSRIMYLSSAQIQQYLLKQLQLTGPSNQDTVISDIKKIFYPVNYNGDIFISDTAQFIAFHIRNKWIASLERKLQNSEENLIKKMKSVILKILYKEDFNFFLPWKIKQTILERQELSLTNLKNKAKIQQQFQEYVCQGVIKLQESSIQKMQEKFLEFLNKSLGSPQLNNLKLIILGQVWGQSKIFESYLNEQQQNIDHQYSQVQANKIETKLPQFQFQLQILDELKSKMNYFLPLNLLRINNKKFLECFVHPKILIQVINSHKKSIYEALKSCDQKTFQHIFKNPSSRGSFLQSILVEILQNGGTKLSIQFSQNIKKQIHLFDIFPQTLGFIPIPPKNSKKIESFKFFDSFLINLQHLLSKQNLKKSKHFSFFLLPAKQQWHTNLIRIPQEKNKKKEERKQCFILNSKVIDFALCQYSTAGNLIQLIVNIFDSTIKQPSKLTDKIRRFFKEMVLNFHDKYDQIVLFGKQCQISINYIVITTENLNQFNCKKQLTKQALLLKNQIELKEYQQPVQKKELKKKRSKKSKKQIKEIKSQTERIMSANEEIQKALENQEPNSSRKLIELKDYKNLCQIDMHQKYKSGSKVINNISVINLFEHMKLQCNNESEVLTELSLLKKFQNAYKKEN